MIETTPVFEPGNSGSPLIHETTGTVVGIASFKQYANAGQLFNSAKMRFEHATDRLGSLEK